MSKKIQRNVKDYFGPAGAPLPQPRGFRLQTRIGMSFYVRLGYVLQKCEGEAHSNAHIDNCSLCMGQVWGWTAVKEQAPMTNAHVDNELDKLENAFEQGRMGVPQALARAFLLGTEFQKSRKGT